MADIDTGPEASSKMEPVPLESAPSCDQIEHEPGFAVPESLAAPLPGAASADHALDAIPAQLAPSTPAQDPNLVSEDVTSTKVTSLGTPAVDPPSIPADHADCVPGALAPDPAGADSPAPPLDHSESTEPFSVDAALSPDTNNEPSTATGGTEAALEAESEFPVECQPDGKSVPVAEKQLDDKSALITENDNSASDWPHFTPLEVVTDADFEPVCHDESETGRGSEIVVGDTAVEEMSVEDFDLDLEAYSRRGRSQNLLGEPVVRGRSGRDGEAHEEKRDRVVSFAEQGVMYRAGRARRPRWAPGPLIYVIAEETEEDMEDEDEAWRKTRRAFSRLLQPQRSMAMSGVRPPLPHAPPPQRERHSGADPSEPGSGADSAVEDFEDRLRSFDRMSSQGAPFIKHVRYGFPHAKLIRVNPFMGTVDWGSGSLNLREALEIKGVRLGNVDPRLCFAVVCPNRTLELQASSEDERDLWVQGLRNVRARLLEGKLPDLDGLNASSPRNARRPRGPHGAGPGLAAGAGAGGDGDAVAEAGHGDDGVADGVDADFMALAEKGSVFIKHGRSGNPKTKIVRVGAASGVVSWGTGQLNLREADIVSGKNTKLFSKVPLKEAHPKLCFSLSGKDRSLDLQCATEEERDLWVEGLQRLKARLTAAPSLKPAKKCLVLNCVEPGKAMFKGFCILHHNRMASGSTEADPELDSGGSGTAVEDADASRDRDPEADADAGEEGEAQAQAQAEAQDEEGEEDEKTLMESYLRLDPPVPVVRQVSVAQFLQRAAQGCTFIKHNWHGNPHTKTVRLSETGVLDWGSGSLNMRDALEVRAGKKLFNVDAHLVLSVIMPERTLDLQAPSKQDRDFWVQGLRALMARLAHAAPGGLGLGLGMTSRPGPARSEVGDDADTDQAEAGDAVAAAADHDLSLSTGVEPTTVDQFLAGPVQSSFVKHGRRGSPHSKLVCVDPSGLVNWGSGALNLRQAASVIPGKNTKVFEKVKLKTAHPRTCFSVVLPRRTLDLQASSEKERDLWVQGLQTLRDHLLNAHASETSGPGAGHTHTAADAGLTLEAVVVSPADLGSGSGSGSGTGDGDVQAVPDGAATLAMTGITVHSGPETDADGGVGSIPTAADGPEHEASLALAGHASASGPIPAGHVPALEPLDDIFSDDARVGLGTLIHGGGGRDPGEGLGSLTAHSGRPLDDWDGSGDESDGELQGVTPREAALEQRVYEQQDRLDALAHQVRQLKEMNETFKNQVERLSQRNMELEFRPAS